MMRILSINVHKNDVKDICKNNRADIYCFQESKIDLQGAKINTVSIFNGECLQKEEALKTSWEDIVPWVEFPENYFCESNIELGFVLINVHLAGFYNKRFSLMSTLLNRLKMDDLQDKTVVLVGDFNAQKGNGKEKSKAQKQGAEYIREIEKIGFVEIFMENESEPKPTYFDKNTGYRYDHVFIKQNEADKLKITVAGYCPESDDQKWYSDHRGIFFEVDKK